MKLRSPKPPLPRPLPDKDLPAVTDRSDYAAATPSQEPTGALQVPVAPPGGRRASADRPAMTVSGPVAAADTVTFDASGTLAELEARDVTAWFGDHMVLEQVSLTMRAGHVT